MLSDDAVVIAVSDAFHVPAAMKALSTGKHVLCEKPLGDQRLRGRGIGSATAECTPALRAGPGVSHFRERRYECFRGSQGLALYQGTTSVVPHRA
jgi:hypothetical protein